jgi:hypothetical protein
MGFSQGIRAIANNISSLSIGLVLMSAEARAAGVSLKTALLGALRGPYGLIVGLQIVIGLIDLWANSQRKAKEQVDELADSMRSETFEVNAMYAAYTKMNPSTEQAEKLKKKLSDQLKVNIEDYATLGEAVAAHIKLLDLMSKATELATKQKKAFSEQIILSSELLTIDQEIEKERLDIEKGRNRTIQSGLGINKDLSTSETTLNFLLARKGDLISKVNESTNYRLKLEKDQIALQDEISALEKDSTETTNNKAKAVKKQKEAYYELNKEYEEHIQLMVKERGLLESAVFKKEMEYKVSMMSKEQQEIEKVRQSYKELYDSLLSNYYIDYITYQEFNDKKARLKEIEQQQILEIEKRYAALRRAEQLKGVNDTLKAEDDARQKALDRIQQTEQAKMQFASNTVGFLISLNAAMAGASEEERRKAFKRDKALRVAQATVDTYAGANRAYATAPATPLGFFLAAAVVAAGLANVATIMGQNYDGGVMGNSRFARGVDGGTGQGIQGGYPYPMTGGSTMQPQFPDRTGSLDIRPRTQRLYVLEADITDAQQAQTDRGMKAGVF